MSLPLISFSYSAEAFKAQLNDKQAESNCIAKLIATKHERSDINANHGGCSLISEQPILVKQEEQ